MRNHLSITKGRAILTLGLALIAVHDFLSPRNDAKYGAIAQSNSLSSSSTSLTSTTNFIRLRANKLRKPELCRDNLPRRFEDLPVLVIVGRVREVYLATASPISNPPQPDPQVVSRRTEQRALVNVGRVIKGDQTLVGSDIVISGFSNSSSTSGLNCPNFVKANDTLILLLTQVPPASSNRYFIYNNNLLSLNLTNLDRVNALASNEIYKRRPPIEEILCEAHYCPYGRCQVNEQTKQTSCQCPEFCSPLPSPVCGSDNSTYTNECHLIREGCTQKRPLFVTKESTC